MTHQIRHLIESLIANIALVRSLVRMCKNMIPEIPLLMERLVAQMALVRFLASMGLPVRNQCRHTIKRFITNLANIGTFSRMDGTMLR